MLTLVHLTQIMRHASHARLEQYLPALNAVMQNYGIVTVRRASAFVAQLAHESGEFQFMEELWGPTPAQKRYEPVSNLATRLGNTQPGDGKRFKGRGPIQVTGRANYQRYGALMGKDLVGSPQLAATPEVGFTTAALFWQKNGLNELADADDFRNITQRINGGQNGAADREQFYALAQEVLKGAFPETAPAGAAKAPAGGEAFPRGAEAVRDEVGAAASVKTPVQGPGHGRAARHHGLSRHHVRADPGRGAHPHSAGQLPSTCRCRSSTRAAKAPAPGSAWPPSPITCCCAGASSPIRCRSAPACCTTWRAATTSGRARTTPAPARAAR